MAASQIRDFTKGNITKHLLTFAFPIFLANLLQVVYNMVDMAVVGHVLGKTGTSAVSVGGDISVLLTFVGIGFGNAGQVLIARYIGAKEQHKIGRFVGTMCGFLMVCAVVISVLGLVFQNKLLTLMNTPPQSFAGAANYSAICMFGMVFIYGYNMVSAVMRGMGDAKHPLVFIGIAATLNVVLDIVFVVWFGFGAGGAALATVISQGVSFITSVVFLAKKRQNFGLNITFGDFASWDRGMLSSLVKLGAPMAIKNASVQVSKLFVNSWVNSYGVEVSAFAGIANKVASVSNMISIAMNTAGSTVVGQNLAAKQFERVKIVLGNLAIIMCSIALTLSAVILFFPEFVFGFFTQDQSVLVLARPYVPIAILLFFGGATRAIMNALLNGSGNYRVNFATAILDGIVMRIGLAVLFGLVLDFRHFGFWLGDALAGFTPFWIGLVFLVSGKWKK